MILPIGRASAVKDKGFVPPGDFVPWWQRKSQKMTMDLGQEPNAKLENENFSW